jgi:hypothetical protein
MVLIRFADTETDCRALGFISRYFSGRTFASRHTLVPEAALVRLKEAGIPFIVERPAVAWTTKPPTCSSASRTT